MTSLNIAIKAENIISRMTAEKYRERSIEELLVNLDEATVKRFRGLQSLVEFQERDIGDRDDA